MTDIKASKSKASTTGRSKKKRVTFAADVKPPAHSLAIRKKARGVVVPKSRRKTGGGHQPNKRQKSK